jgi:hypothetical protein
MGGAWGCPHEEDDRCGKVNNLPCDPGMKGCVLHGRFVFANDDKNQRLRQKQGQREASAPPPADLKNRPEVEHAHRIDRAFPGALLAQAGDLRAFVTVQRRRDAGAAHGQGEFQFLVVHPDIPLPVRRSGAGFHFSLGWARQFRQPVSRFPGSAIRRGAGAPCFARMRSPSAVRCIATSRRSVLSLRARRPSPGPRSARSAPPRRGAAACRRSASSPTVAQSRAGETLDVQQQQVLQRRDAVPARHLFAEAQEAAQPVAEFGKRFEFLLAQAWSRHGGHPNCLFAILQRGYRGHGGAFKVSYSAYITP